MSSEEALTPVFWSEADPGRLARDTADLAAFAPGLTYMAPSVGDEEAPAQHGGWHGTLPLWPFPRPEPDGIQALTNGDGLDCVVLYSAVHPVIPPTIIAVNPEPLIPERTQHRWHVAPGGSLCLLQTIGDWTPESSITELLEKAAGWRIEYALMKRGAIDKMTTNGIASDPSLDHLIDEVSNSTGAGE